MKKLSPDQRSHLEKLVRKTRDVNERNRVCVILGRDDSHSPKEIADILRISESSVYDYLREYDDREKTINDPHLGRLSKLEKDQEAELKKHLVQETYLKVKQICLYVKEKYKVEYTIAGMRNWLQRQGFVYKTPVHVPGKLDPVKQELFIEKYNELKSSLKENEVIYFCDAVHPEYQSHATAGWILEGEVKTLGTTAKQERLHFIGAVELTEMHIVTKEYSTVNAESMIDFLKVLESSSEASKIHLILDNGRANKNKEVQKYLAEQTRIEVHYLPPYSPNLNSIERLWKVMREQVTYNRLYPKFKDFTEKIRDFFATGVVRLKEQLKKRINDKFQIITLNPLQTSSC
jgi:transposase